MIQSIDFITNGLVTAAVELSDEDIAAYCAANRDKYYIRPFVTFTHVFVDGSRRGRNEAISPAHVTREELNGKRFQFSNTPRHGDRFPFFVDYVECDSNSAASHLGAATSEPILALQPGDQSWHG